MNPSTDEPLKSIPKKIHFIWVGGAIPRHYLEKIITLAELAKISGFELTIWVDEDKHYRHTLNEIKRCLYEADLEVTDAQLDKILGIRIRNIDDLQNRMMGKGADAFYAESPGKAKSFWCYLHREMIGFRNLAAASDLLRYEIIRQKGGYYLDTDTKLPGLDLVSTLKADSNKFGVKLNFDVFRDIHDVRGTNDIFGAIADHDILRNAIDMSLENYKKLDKKIKLWYDEETGQRISSQVDFHVREGVTKMDIKRYPYANPISRNDLSRRMLTILTAGPGALRDAAFTFWGKQPKKSKADLKKCFSLQGIDESQTAEIMGIEVKTKSDQTWLYGQGEKGRGFDDYSIPVTLFSHFIKKKHSLTDNTNRQQTHRLSRGSSHARSR